jgi:hypothetical protein
MRIRRRRDGATEIAPWGRLRSAALAGGVALLAFPVLLTLVAVLPVIALALPPLLVATALYPAWRRLRA